MPATIPQPYTRGMAITLPRFTVKRSRRKRLLFLSSTGGAGITGIRLLKLLSLTGIHRLLLSTATGIRRLLSGGEVPGIFRLISVEAAGILRFISAGGRGVLCGLSIASIRWDSKSRHKD